MQFSQLLLYFLMDAQNVLKCTKNEQVYLQSMNVCNCLTKFKIKFCILQRTERSFKAIFNSVQQGTRNTWVLLKDIRFFIISACAKILFGSPPAVR